MKKNLLMILTLTSGLLFSCNSNNKEENREFTIDVVSQNCQVSGLKETYKKNEVANLVLSIESDFYTPLTKNNIKIHGAKEFTFDETTSTLSFVVDTNVGLEVIPTAIYGKEATYYEAATLIENIYDEDNPQFASSVDVKWEIDPYGTLDNEANTIINELLMLNNVDFYDKQGKLPELQGNLKFDYDSPNELESLSLLRNNNRINPTEKDKCFVNEDVIVTDLYSFRDKYGKYLNIQGHVILHYDKTGYITYRKIDLTHTQYKDVTIRKYGYIEFNFHPITEGGK